MKNFGLFLANLRGSAGLSLEDLARLVNASRSAISRLENNEVPRPFKGSARSLAIVLAEILCTSERDIQRYLDLSEIDPALLTESEEMQLGLASPVKPGSPNEAAALEHRQQIYQSLLTNLEAGETRLGFRRSPSILKLKIQEYKDTLQEIQRRLDRLCNRQDATESDTTQLARPYFADSLEGKLVVGNRYGENLDTASISSDLYSLASVNANWLMELADVERFAADDCILLTNSRDFVGWSRDEIKTTILSRSLPIPDDLAELQEKKLSAIKDDYNNSSHYRLASHTPSFIDLKRLEVTLAPLSFFDYYSLTLFFDEPLLTALDGSKVSIRQKYGHTALTYSSTDRGMSLIPTPISIQCIVVTKDQYIFLMRRSSFVAFYPEHWSASFEETMNAPGKDRRGDSIDSGDADFFAGALRGLEEEFAIPANAVEDIKVLSLNVEYLTLSLDVFTVIRLGLSAEEIRQRWLLKAWNRDEASRFALLSADLDAVVDRLFSRTMWHPTSRMRLIQFLFHIYGIDEVARAIKEKRDS